MHNIKEIQAFTLIELSIVITIIGLIVGATFVGADLINNSETKTLLSEVQKFKSSITQFQTLYKGLPGDVSNAQSYWPSSANGNGDGQIAAETSNEAFRALQQLYLANLVDGAYYSISGTWGTGFVLADAVTTGNIISSKARQDVGIYIKCCSSTDYSRSITFNNHISVSAPSGTKRYGAFTPIEAKEIDQKIDDGVPDTGLVGGSGNWTGAAYAATGCYSSTGSSSTYDTAVAANNKMRYCQMQFAYDWN